MSCILKSQSKYQASRSYRCHAVHTHPIKFMTTTCHHFEAQNPGGHTHGSLRSPGPRGHIIRFSQAAFAIHTSLYQILMSIDFIEILVKLKRECEAAMKAARLPQPLPQPLPRRQQATPSPKGEAQGMAAPAASLPRQRARSARPASPNSPASRDPPAAF